MHFDSVTQQLGKVIRERLKKSPEITPKYAILNWQQSHGNIGDEYAKFRQFLHGLDRNPRYLDKIMPKRNKHVLPQICIICEIDTALDFHWTMYGYFDTYINTVHVIIDQYDIRRM